MRAYLMKRLLLAIPTLIGISLIVFFISQLIPGSPIAMEIYKIRQSGAPGVDTEKLAAELAKQYDFDKPLPVRYFKWLKGMATLDFGISIKDNRPVWDKIAERIPISLQISFISLLLAYLISIPLGVYSSVKQDTWSEGVLTVFLFVLYSLPNFWVATLLMMFLCGGQFWNVFPIAGMSSRGAESLALLPWLLDRVWHLALPVACMTYGSLAFLSRFAKSGMLEVIRQDYITTARAKGLSEKTVIFKHAFRNSLIPLVTLAALLVPAMLGGSIIIETIFGIPGMGQLSFEAILSRDYPLIMGITTIMAVLTLIGLLLSDVLYVLIDPRISFEER